MRRNGDARLAKDYPWVNGNIRLRDVADELATIIEAGGLVMLEGTQGSGLSLIHGTQYPYATSTDTNASGLASEAGIAPSDVGHVQLVARTFPIRVAGTSGPMGKELDWSYFTDNGLAAKAGADRPSPRRFGASRSGTGRWSTRPSSPTARAASG